MGHGSGVDRPLTPRSFEPRLASRPGLFPFGLRIFAAAAASSLAGVAQSRKSAWLTVLALPMPASRMEAAASIAIKVLPTSVMTT